MDETYPYAYRPELAARVTPVVEGMVGAALERISARGRWQTSATRRKPGLGHITDKQ